MLQNDQNIFCIHMDTKGMEKLSFFAVKDNVN